MATLGQPRQARDVTDHAPDLEYGRLSGSPGAAGKAPSHRQESQTEDNNAKAILRAARAGDEGSRAQLQSYRGGRGRGGRGGRGPGRGRGRGKGRNVPPLRQLCVRALRRPRAGNGMLVGALVVSLAANLYLVLR